MPPSAEPGDEAFEVVLVEDNDNDAELMLRSLHRHNVANPVLRIPDGAAALDYFARLADDDHPLPRVVFLDIKLPFVDGVEVLRAIRTNPRTAMLPVVMLTSSAQDADVSHSYGNGANAYVVKPLEFTNFVETIGALGMFWVVVNTPPRPRPGSAPPAGTEPVIAAKDPGR